MSPRFAGTLVCLLLSAGSPTRATSPWVQQIGVAASQISGTGLTYEAWRGRVGLRCSGFAVCHPDLGPLRRRLTWDVGLALLAEHRHDGQTRYYFIVGGQYWYDRNEANAYSVIECGPKVSALFRRVPRRKFASGGVAFGTSWHIAGRLHGHGEAGVKYRFHRHGLGPGHWPGAGAGIAYRL